MTVIHERVERARRGESPAVVARLRSGWVVMGDEQALPGYCLLLPDPVVPSLNDLRDAARDRYLADMAAIGDALLAVTDAVRVNYEILGNVVPALHAHVLPRYAWEPEPQRLQPQWLHDRTSAPRFDPAVHGELRQRIADALAAAGVLRDGR